MITFGIGLSIGIILSIITGIGSYFYVIKNLNQIENILDQILNHTIDFTMKMEEDTRISKLAHKAMRIVQMNMLDISQTQQEKEKIQSYLSDMSHQMKTPLASVRMYTELLIDTQVTKAERSECLLRIKNGIEKIQWMMDSLLKLSRLEAGAIELIPLALGIKNTISDSITNIYGEAEKKNITINTAYFEDTCLIHDKKWTVEAISNILENAIKYSKSEGVIDIKMEVMPIYAKISITDYGIGIPREDWNNIFKRFYRGKNVHAYNGAGLGLYLSALILNKQGGYIMVDSKLDEYTTFSIFLQNCKKNL